MITYVALPFQVKELTGSFVLVGVLGLVELVPLIVFGLYGGALADAVDRRRMVLLTEGAFMLLSGVLLVNALVPHPRCGRSTCSPSSGQPSTVCNDPRWTRCSPASSPTTSW